jgi:hypothetical protein
MTGYEISEVSGKFEISEASADLLRIHLYEFYHAIKPTAAFIIPSS